MPPCVISESTPSPLFQVCHHTVSSFHHPSTRLHPEIRQQSSGAEKIGPLLCLVSDRATTVGPAGRICRALVIDFMRPQELLHVLPVALILYTTRTPLKILWVVSRKATECSVPLPSSHNKKLHYPMGLASIDKVFPDLANPQAAWGLTWFGLDVAVMAVAAPLMPAITKPGQVRNCHRTTCNYSVTMSSGLIVGLQIDQNWLTRAGPFVCLAPLGLVSYGNLQSNLTKRACASRNGHLHRVPI